VLPIAVCLLGHDTVCCLISGEDEKTLSADKTAHCHNPRCLLTLSIYRVIYKSLLDFRPLRYSSRNGRGACQQRERHSKFLSYLTGARYVYPLVNPDTSFSHTLDSLDSHSAAVSCTTHQLLCPAVVLCGTWFEPPLHRHY
jgi:hypothetical protein